MNLQNKEKETFLLRKALLWILWIAISTNEKDNKTKNDILNSKLMTNDWSMITVTGCKFGCVGR